METRARLCCWGLVGLALAASPAGGTDAQTKEAWRALFAQTAPAAVEGQIDAVLAACNNDAAAIRSLIASDTAYPTFKPGWLHRTVKVTDRKTEYDVEFFIRIPPGYTPARSWPLLITAHGTGGNGRRFGAGVELRLGAAGGKYVMLCPTLPGPKHFNARAYQEQTYLKPLDWVRRKLNIDDDRVYITGYSQGGHVTWHMATMYPRLFAAAVPMAGVPWFEGGLSLCNSYLENLQHLPMWAIWGEKDKVRPGALGDVDLCRAATKRLAELGNTNFTPGEVPGGGHFDCWPRRGKLAVYLASHTRRAAPAKFAHFFHLPHHRRGYYVEAVEFLRKPADFSRKPKVVVRVKPGQTVTPEQATEHVRRHYERLMFRMWVQLDRPANSLTIRASGIRTVRVYVIEGMFDLDKPITLRWGSRAWRGKVPLSPKCILTHYAATRDAASLVCNEIDFRISGKAGVRFK